MSYTNTLTPKKFETLGHAAMETARGLSFCAALARFARP